MRNEKIWKLYLIILYFKQLLGVVAYAVGVHLCMKKYFYYYYYYLVVDCCFVRVEAAAAMSGLTFLWEMMCLQPLTARSPLRMLFPEVGYSTAY